MKNVGGMSRDVILIFGMGGGETPECHAPVVFFFFGWVIFFDWPFKQE